ncbi:CocE/NonD family hydrolase [Pigmentiphaga litoralis]|uniref:CocE/NonD family hydrolase n=1 Tax=Pigmentiphaga litoralis TaxID=516702 RepID=UPI003B43B3D9
MSLLPVLPARTLSMTTRDGVRLDADVWQPATGGPYPVLLMRQAYGRGVASTVCYAHPAWYAAHGYVVVIQDFRGRGTSEGFFRIGEHEREDGIDTIAWAAQLPGTTGTVGMYGFSYQAFNQLILAGDDCPALKAIAPAMGPWQGREGWSHVNGALRLQGSLGWATQLAADTARHEGMTQAFTELMAASRGLPLYETVQARPAYMERHREISHYHRWVDTPADDPYWTGLSAAARLPEIAARKLPMLFIGGWYDTFLEPTIEGFRAVADAGVPARLVVGPWLHFPWVRKVGGMDFGPAADGGMDELQVRWFDRWLKDVDNGVDQEAPVHLFDLGSKSWREFGAWPEAPVEVTLSTTGKASIDAADGGLHWPVTTVVAAGPSAAAAAPITAYVAHDPWRPVPAFGGAFGVPNGPADRSGIDARGDVLTFTTAPLPSPVTLAGDVVARLTVTSDRPSFDVSCVLSRVTPSGQAIALTDGYRHCRTRPADAVVTITMQSTCVTVAAGESLRLSIAASAFPAYPVNPGTGEDPTRAASIDAQVITLGIACGGDTPSVLQVSMPPVQAVPS